MRQKVWHSARKGEDAGASELFIPRNQSIGSQRKDGCDGDGEKKVRFVSALESRRQRSFVMTSVVFHHAPGRKVQVCDAAMTHDSLNPVTFGDEVQLMNETRLERQFAEMDWMPLERTSRR